MKAISDWKLKGLLERLGFERSRGEKENSKSVSRALTLKIIIMPKKQAPETEVQ